MHQSRLLGLFCACAFISISTLSCNHDDDPNSGAQTPVVNPTPGSISLMVNERIGSKCEPLPEPLQDASVTAMDTNSFYVDVTTKTDALGEALLELPPGIYDIRIETDGHKTVTAKISKCLVKMRQKSMK